MLFSYLELKRLANLGDEITVDQVANAINSIGFEVEEIKEFNNVSALHYGKIVEITKNPAASGLNVCRIKFSDKERIIQTVANVYEGATVAAILPGDFLAGNKVTVKELRGINSEGMITILEEYGVPHDLNRDGAYDQIIDHGDVDLDRDPIIDLDLHDHMIDVDILSNRSDASSYYVMAMEIAAYFKTKANIPSLKEGKYDSELSVRNGLASSLVFLEQRGKVPLTIKERVLLGKHGIQSVNDFADLSNLTLIYTGQPTHVYDQKNVGKEFTTGRSSKEVHVFGNKVVQLDNTLVVTSNNEDVCVASVIGLENHRTSQDTQNTFFEMGIFPIKDVRDASKTVKLNTMAANQGGKKHNVGTTKFALKYLTNRLDHFSNPINLVSEDKKTINWKEEDLFKVVGKDISGDKEYKDAIISLQNLGFIFENNTVVIPEYRYDIESKEDINEEVLRFYGYNKIEESKPTFESNNPKNIISLKDKVSNLGYQEVRTYSLLSKELNIINPFEIKTEVPLHTFVSVHREVYRYSQAMSLIDIATYNVKRNITDFSIFAQGMIANEKHTIAGLSTIKDFRSIQQDIINIIPKAKFIRKEFENLHPNMSAEITLEGRMIGWIAKIHPGVSSVDGIIFELQVEDYSQNSKFEEYKNKQLDVSDHNIILGQREDIRNHITKYDDAISVKVIDEYKTDENLKVTVRVKK